MRKITLLLFLFSVAVTQGQSFEWLQTPQITFNFNPDNISYPVTTDPAGNVYMAGYKENPVQYTETFGAVFVNKYDPSGNLLHAFTIGGSATVYDMSTDSDGNLIMAVGYINSISLGSIALLTVEQGVQFLLLKYNPQGNLIWHWAIIMDSINVNDFRTVTTDSDSNIYIGFGDYQHSRIIKLSPEGEHLMTIYQQYTPLITSLSVDNAGNIYAAGACAAANASFAGVAVPSAPFYNTYIVKYSPDGVFQWLKYIEDITCPNPQVKAKSPDEVYFSSYLFGNYPFDNLTTEGPVNGGFTDFFLSKLDASGAFQWVREVPGAGAAITGKRNYLDLDDAGNIYFAGGTKGTVNWGNGITTTVAGFSDDALLLKYNPDGELLMAVTAGGEGYDRTDGIKINTAGDIFLSGMVAGNASFGNLIHEGTDFQYTPFITKITSSPLSLPETSAGNVYLYPNPASDRLFIANAANAKGSVFNVLGQKIKDLELTDGMALQVSELAKGTYFIKLNGYKTMRFIKE